MRYLVLGLLGLLFWNALSCTSDGASGLPVIGRDRLVERQVNGETVVDTFEHTIPDFTFINQDSTPITEQTVAGKIYLADFFFTSCPTICPRVKKNMKKVYSKYKDHPDVLILSHSIDTKYDTVGRLAWYADKMNIESSTWHLLTGDKKAIYDIAQEYYIAALEAEDAPGGYDHSGLVALVDRQRRIRGLYDGTDPEKMAELTRDLQLLLDNE